MVFNHLGWQRSGIAHLQLADPSRYIVIDLNTGKPVPVQSTKVDDQNGISFEAKDIPSIGYRVFALREGSVPQASGTWKFTDHGLEGPFYKITINPATGGITSLVDKVRGKELVDSTRPYHLNQLVYWSDRIENIPASATIYAGEAGEVFAQLIVESEVNNILLKTTITLYSHLDRIDIRP